MKIRYVDRDTVTPKSFGEHGLGADALPEGDLADCPKHFGESRPQGLAVSILNCCVKSGGWAPFSARIADAFPDRAWLPRFARAGLLLKFGRWYGVTDLFILWLSHRLGKPEGRALKSALRHSIRMALMEGDRAIVLFDDPNSLQHHDVRVI